MSSDKVYLTRDEQNFLMNMYEVDDPEIGFENFVIEMTKQHADINQVQTYIRKALANWEKEGKK